jgi:hypothetical protein
MFAGLARAFDPPVIGSGRARGLARIVRCGRANGHSGYGQHSGGRSICVSRPVAREPSPFHVAFVGNPRTYTVNP